MRIFLGLTDVANITATYAKGFRALGHQVFSAVWNKSYFYPDSKYDLVIDNRNPGTRHGNNLTYLKIIVQMAQLARALNCDLFIMYAPAVLPTRLYYSILKLLGKKILTAFWGSDIRYWYAFSEEMKCLDVQNEVSPFFEYAKNRSGGSYWDKLRTVRVAEKYSDLIISQPDCAQLQTRPYMRANIPLDLSDYAFHIPDRSEPLILHAPSVPEAKGTDVVLRVVDELRVEGVRFQFRLIEKMPNKELRQILTKSDIVVDELYATTVGGLSAESMATGNAVLVRYMPEYAKVPAGCPAINVNIFTLKEHLRRVILDRDLRKQLAIAGRPYVAANNDHIKVCQELLDWLEQKSTLNFDFYPSFYKNLAIPEQIIQGEKRDKGTKRKEFFNILFSTGTTKKK